MRNDEEDDARRLLELARVVRHPCDLDLLLFFARHPRVLLASESVASFLGYDRKMIARSLEGLLTAGLLTRRQAATHAARLYVFAGGGAEPEWLFPLVRVASTRQGRRTLLAILHERTGVQEPDDRLNDFEYGRVRPAGPRPVGSPSQRRRQARGEHGNGDDS